MISSFADDWHGIAERVTRTRCVGIAAILLGIASGLAADMAAAQSLPWMNPSLAPEERAALLIGAMMLEQKVAQLHGTPGSTPEVPECGALHIRHVPGIPSLGIPTFRMADGPVGIGPADCDPQDPATALPSALALAASFDPELASTYGDVLGDEAFTLGAHVLFAPAMNMARVGQGGRNFEYLGEDPFLAGTIAAAEIRAIQNRGIMSMAKHFALNEQETYRDRVNVVVDDRTLHQLYLLPFEMSVKDGNVSSIMCAYNRVNGPYACDSPHLLTEVLRNQWGFTGFVQSDFGATRSTATSLNAGEDLEMWTGTWYSTSRIASALASGSLTMATIDWALTRRYEQMFKFGVFDRPIPHGPVNAVANGQTSRLIAEQTAVLLKNTGGVLPLNPAGVRTIALIGQATFAGAALTGGGGSSAVRPTYTVTPVQGLRNVLASLGSTATVNLLIVPNNPTSANLAAVTNAAAAADVVIVMAGVVTTEGSDRPSLSLPSNQDAIINAAWAPRKPRTVLVLKDADPVTMSSWGVQIPAILETWHPGQEDGNAVARLLFGLVNPSGRLPVTYPRTQFDTPTGTTPQRYPGVSVNGVPTVTYSEGLQMGYRWYDARNITPMFPFGHGLSYTQFAYGPVSVTPAVSDGTSPISVQFTVQNVGSRPGADVPQVYVGFDPSLGEPPKRLVAFKKVTLNPGEEIVMTLTIDPNASSHPISTWDSASQSWVVAQGRLTFSLGRSVRDITSSAVATVLPPQ